MKFSKRKREEQETAERDLKRLNWRLPDPAVSLSPSTLSGSEAGGVGASGPQPAHLPQTTVCPLAMMESSISPPDPGLFPNRDMADAIDWDNPFSEVNVMAVRRVDMSEVRSGEERKTGVDARSKATS